MTNENCCLFFLNKQTSAKFAFNFFAVVVMGVNQIRFMFRKIIMASFQGAGWEIIGVM